MPLAARWLPGVMPERQTCAVSPNARLVAPETPPFSPKSTRLLQQFPPSRGDKARLECEGSAVCALARAEAIAKPNQNKTAELLLNAAATLR